MQANFLFYLNLESINVLGAFGAVGALTYGLYTMWRRDQRRTQLAVK